MEDRTMMKRSGRNERRGRAPTHSSGGRLRIVSSKRKRAGHAEPRGPRAHTPAPPQRALVMAPYPDISVPAYEWLSTEDRMFLHFEQANAPMHMGAMLLFEGGPLSTPSGRIDLQRIRNYIGAQ